MKKRIQRIMPTYLCFISVWLVYHILVNAYPLQSILGNILCLQIFTDVSKYSFNWYMGGLWLSYLLVPYLWEIIEKQKKAIGYCGIVMFFILVSLVFCKSHIQIMMMARLPIFVLGMIIGKLRNFVLSKRLQVALVSSFFVGIIVLFLCYEHLSTYLWSYGLHWYPFLMIVPGLCMIMSYVGALCEKSKIGSIIVAWLGTVGKYTFEIYLIHVWVFDIIKENIQNNNLSDNNVVWCSGILIVIIGCLALHWISTFFSVIGKCKLKCYR